MSNLHIKERIQLAGLDIDMPCITQMGFDGFNKPIPLDEHVHQGFEFTYIDNGLVTWELGDHSVLQLNGNDMALTQPYTPHKGQFDVISPASLFWISFDFSRKECLKKTAAEGGKMGLGTKRKNMQTQTRRRIDKSQIDHLMTKIGRLE